LQEAFNLPNDDLLRAASGFAGGIARMEETCGALVGAMMFLGLKYGRSQSELASVEKLNASNVTAGRLYKWFEKEYGSVMCRDIRTRFAGVYYNPNVDWQVKLAETAGVPQKCAELNGKTAAMAASIWLEK
jgi:C_GCAxxG_C_C family probable redox protein